MGRHAKFSGGRNIAMKVPPHAFDATVRFYREVVGLEELPGHAPSVAFAFGACTLWIDRVAGLSQAEIWLELVSDDVAAAADQLRAAGSVRCDEIEPLPEGFDGFWVLNPASVVHLVSGRRSQ